MNSNDLTMYAQTRALQRLSYEHLHEYEVNDLQRAANSVCRINRIMGGYREDQKLKYQREKARRERKALGMPRYVRKEKLIKDQYNG